MNITNFRDIGGSTTRLGKIKEKRLLRSGELYELSKADKLTLQNEYNLKLIIDLRSSDEVSEHPDSEIIGARYLNLDVLAYLEKGNVGFDNLMQRLDLASVDAHMKEIYSDIVVNKVASRGYGQFLTEISNLSDGSAIFHCFAGKDRTGLGAALLLDILGASKDDIYADYMLTNTMREEANKILCDASTKKHNLSTSQVEALKHFLLVKEDYISETYKTINAIYGSMENYILEGLKVTPEILDKIRAGCLQ